MFGDEDKGGEGCGFEDCKGGYYIPRRCTTCGKLPLVEKLSAAPRGAVDSSRPGSGGCRTSCFWELAVDLLQKLGGSDQKLCQLSCAARLTISLRINHHMACRDTPGESLDYDPVLVSCVNPE